MDRVLLIDAHNQLWRANMTWGKSKEENKEGEHSYIMIYNFFRNLRATVEQFTPHKIFFVLEGYPKHRHQIYGEYKANRIIKVANNQEVFDDFHFNKREVIRLCGYLPITTCKASDYECDDVIATLADNLKNEEVIIISNDSDYIQLLQKGYKNIKIYNPIKKIYMEPTKYPYLAWKCLAGDKSDNIPGLVSAAKAEKLVTNPSLFAQWMELEENRSNFSINKSLIEFADVPVDQIEMTNGEANYKALREEFLKMKFESIIKDPIWSKFCNTFNCITF